MLLLNIRTKPTGLLSVLLGLSRLLLHLLSVAGAVAVLAVAVLAVAGAAHYPGPIQRFLQDVLLDCAFPKVVQTRGGQTPEFGVFQMLTYPAYAYA